MKINALKDNYLYLLDVCPRTDSFCFKEDQNWDTSPIHQHILKADIHFKATNSKLINL